MRFRLYFVATVLASGGGATTAPAETATMILLPAGIFLSAVQTEPDAKPTGVPAFLLDERPVTNADFLAFVSAVPGWRRSRVSPLLADSSYLQHWSADLEPGGLAPAGAPVVHVSWFAARAFARWAGKRLPSTTEWEYAASAGFTRPDSANDEALQKALYEWLARPVPAVLADAASVRPDFHGIRGLHGLVWEWVDDFNAVLVTGESRADSALDRDLYCGAGAAGAKNPADYAAFMRLALRSSLRGNNTTSSLGFRCAQSAGVPPASSSSSP